MCPAKVEHLLGFDDATYHRAGQTTASNDEAKGRDAKGLCGCTNKGDVAVAAEQVDIGVDVMISGDSVKDEIKAASVLLHLVCVVGDDDFVGTEAEGVSLLAGRGGEDDDVGSERMSKLHAQVAQSAETDHANFLALCDAPAAHGRVCCDPGAEQRRSPGKIEVGGDAQDEAFVNDDALGVATIGDACEVLVRGVVGEDYIWAELLKASPTLGTRAVRIYHAANRGEVTRLELGNCRADLGYTADDFVAGDNRVDSGYEATPLVTHLVEVGVADATEEDFDLNVAFG